MSATASAEATISRDQFKRLAEEVSKQAPAILKERDKSDKAMDKKSALLRALHTKLREKLGLPPEKLTTKGFKTYEFAYAQAVYRLAEERATKPFDYEKIVDEFMSKALG
jgi:aminopeptidase C